MKLLPFNACDYRCERCLVTGECAVYQKTREHLGKPRPDGGDGEDDLSAVLDDIRATFQETKEKIRAGAEEFGIDIDDIPANYFEEEERKHEASMNDALFRRASDFTDQAREFLKTIDSLLDEEGDSRSFYEDVNWHHTIVSAKTFRAVSGEGNEYLVEDVRNSAAVAVKSLTICSFALEELASRFPDKAEACGKLGGMASSLKVDIRARWLLGQ